MKLFTTLRAAKRPEMRASGASALVTATKMPNSGLAFVDNSQGSAAAIVELSHLLDVALEQFDFDGEPSDQLQLQLQRLYKQGAKYANSRLNDSIQAQEWSCSPAEAGIISIAFACAAAVYNPNTTPSVPGFNFEHIGHIDQSFAGTIKPVSFSVVSQLSFIEPQPANSLLPLLVVAVRGTAGKADHMINMNDRGKDIGPLFDIGKISLPDRKIEGATFAHAGLLHSAEALAPLVSKQIDAVIEKYQIKHILFTGHSAGGAVSSLLFAKFLSLAKMNYPLQKFSSISFGAPPVTRPNLAPHVLGANDCVENRGMVLSIVNEYDLVSRADGPYARSVIDLYRSIYDLPPIQDDNEQDMQVPQLPKLSFETRSADQGPSQPQLPKWPLPKSEYWHIGQIVVFKVKLARSGTDNRDGYRDDELKLQAVTVSPAKFAKLLFCDVSSHRRISYKDRVDLLLKGRFNGREAW